MIFTAPMTQLLALVLGKDSKAVTEAILREGSMQLVRVSEFETEGLKDMAAARSGVSMEEISDLRKRVEGLLHSGGIIPYAPKETDLNNRVAVNIRGEKERLDKIDAERESIRERQRALQQEILKLEDIRRQAQIYGAGLSGMALPARQSLLAMQTGKLPVSNVKQLDEGLKGLPALSVPLGAEDTLAHYLVVSMKRDSEQIDKVLNSVGWSKLELPGSVLSDKKNLLDEIAAKLRTLTDEQKKLQLQAEGLIKREEAWLRALWVSLRINELCFKIEASFKSSSLTVIFAGWVPTSEKDRMIARIKEAGNGRCYIESYDAQSREVIGEEVPVVLENPKALAPFQMLVSNFGVPQYGTIDPTPFVMPIYLTMFGLMFADAGHGLVLAILGVIGALFFKGKEEKRSWYQISWLAMWCGAAAIVFGVLFGSYFGFGLFEPLWFDFHGIVSGHRSGSNMIGSVYDILLVTLYFGICVIGVGLAFNWINLIRTGQWAELVFDKGGILGGWMYAGGVYTGFYMVGHGYKGYPAGATLFMLVGLPALLLLVKQPLYFFSKGAEHGDKAFNPLVTPLNFLMEWMVELLEIFSGYLSNTLSFMRVAGLGIAHVCLMIAIFSMAGMTGAIFSAVIMVLGNALVIGLEGLSAGVQALRLNYYEFFSKFFHGTGSLHTPISLNSKV